MQLLKTLWDDEQGAVVSVEILVIATVLVIGLIAGWSWVRNATLQQIENQADWISGETVDEFEVDPSADNFNFSSEIITCSDVIGSGA